MTFSPAGDRLLSAGAAAPALLWDHSARDASPQAVVADALPNDGDAGPDNGPSARAFFSEGGNRVVVAWPGRPAVQYDARTRAYLWETGGSKRLLPLASTPDGSLLASADRNGQIRILETNSGEEVRRIAWDTPVKWSLDGGPPPHLLPGPSALAFSPDGRTLAAVGFDEHDGAMRRRLVVWEVASGEARLRADRVLVREGRLLVLGDRRATRQSLLFAPDGKTLAHGDDGVVSLIDLDSGREIRQLAGKEVNATVLAYAPDGELLAAGGHDGSVRLWRTRDGSVVRDLPAHGRAVTALAFSPDGRRLATGSEDTTILVWDVARVTADGRDGAGRLTSVEAEALCRDLGSRDAARAFRAVAALVRSPEEAVTALRSRLRPVSAADRSSLAKLTADLGSERYAARERATRELERLGELARPAVRELLARNPPPEARQRAESVLRKLDGPLAVSDLLTAARGIEVLERVGNAAARQVLADLAAGAPASRITQDARASLRRLERRDQGATRPAPPSARPVGTE